MKVIIVGPNIDDSRQIGGIISVIQMTLSVISIPFVYFSRSPKFQKKGLLGLLRWLLKVPQFKKFIKTNSEAVVHVHTALNTSAILRDYLWVRIARRSHYPVILHVHGGSYLFKLPKNRLVKKVLFQMFRSSTALIVLSETEKKAVHELYKVAKEHINVLENAIDLLAIPQFSEQDKSDRLKLLFLGRLSENKGLDDIAVALSGLRESGLGFYFDLYGQGPLESLVVPLLSEKLQGQFTFHGLAVGDQKWKALQEADVFLLPSRYGEGLPMAILEAMALGKIVVATNDASIGIVVKHKENGFIVDKYSPESIVKTIEYIAGLNAEALNKIRANAKKTILNSYSAESYIKRLESIYTKVLEKS